MTTTQGSIAPAHVAGDLDSILAELNKHTDTRVQLGTALWWLFDITEALVIDHTPCTTTNCATCSQLQDALTIFNAIDALLAQELDDIGGTP
jgi:hypothetical protein